jgi:aconitate hydratase
MYTRNYAEVFEGDERWRALDIPEGDRFAWDESSTYVRQPPYFEGMSAHAPRAVPEIRGARVVALLGDSVTTDHISPAGSIRKDSPAGRHLLEAGVEAKDFNSYGSRRGNHEVMVRGTFANVRIRNRLAPGTEGGYTTFFPDEEITTIYEAAERYQAAGTPLIVLAGQEYGSGSSRDWAAKGPNLQGIRAVIAESYERIHRSNLVGMGILPLQFLPGDSVDTLALTGREHFDFEGVGEAIASGFAGGRQIRVTATAEDGSSRSFEVTVRIDTPQEILYYQHGGILQFVLRQLLSGREEKPKGGMAAVTAEEREPKGADDKVEEGSIESFPASDPPAY